jgi:adenosyl cobinamide kinase/adenosyl cobinamide phosphate guanylyltransferase
MTLLLGGVRSGKSDLAVHLARRWHGSVAFMATARAFDDDMARRIARHQADRPPEWTLLERPELSAADIEACPVDHLVVVDCITLLVSNLMLVDRDEWDITDHITELATVLAPRASVVVSNEVGMGVHPPTDLGRRYRDVLGRANTILAAYAAHTHLVMAGKTFPLTDPPMPW